MEENVLLRKIEYIENALAPHNTPAPATSIHSTPEFLYHRIGHSTPTLRTEEISYEIMITADFTMIRNMKTLRTRKPVEPQRNGRRMDMTMVLVHIQHIYTHTHTHTHTHLLWGLPCSKQEIAAHPLKRPAAGVLQPHGAKDRFEFAFIRACHCAWRRESAQEGFDRVFNRFRPRRPAATSHAGIAGSDLFILCNHLKVFAPFESSESDKGATR
jgi:hypothetical protein